MARIGRGMAQVNQAITEGVHDPGSALKTTLQDWVRHDLRISQHLDQPLIALGLILAELLARPHTFYEFARQVNVTWGQLTGDSPRFQKPGQPPHPDVEYSHVQLRAALQQLQADLQKDERLDDPDTADAP